MNVFPQDLAPRWHTAVIRARIPPPRRGGAFLSASRAGGEADARTQPRKTQMGILERFWTGGADLSEAALAEGLAGMGRRTHIARRLATIVPAVLVAVASVSAAASHSIDPAIGMMVAALPAVTVGLLMPRALFRRAYSTPLTAAEIEQLLPTTRDELDRVYLTLAVDVIAQGTATIPEETQATIRGALRTLGEAMDGLPPGSGAGEADNGDMVNAATLRTEADRVRAEASREPDAVAEASLLRQADALVRRADAVERSATLLRRTHLLRRELIAQAEALRAGLAGFHSGAALDVVGLTDLAESLRGVAGEATTVARARAELDTTPAAAPVVTVGQAR